MAITDWPEGERPREKLLQRGPAALSDAELLAIFLRVGVTGKSAVDLARDLLQHFGSLTRLFNAAQAEFTAFPGMGPAKYAQLQAVLEMARRALGEDMKQGDALNSPRAVRDYLRLRLGGRNHEIFMVVFLDAQNRVLAAEELFRGTLTQTSVYPREIVIHALRHNAAGVILAHNHPSGVAEPSQADRWLTDQLKTALGLVDVKVIDHFIVAGSDGFSFCERGWL
ncbi:MAG: DNA repair protein RadC [Pseudomonadota bacterium]|nr:DNA repair protein RadC [Pseudomonadota bacterium]MDP1906383.1 DNA repair protein RadC [Pseudomonadota bacterium]MDP2351482.1 DNA repair protein RadC [Pseudomonadota bacterium]